ncbi:MAG TPA: FliA/WhiG family RNA polymerase sigma factor [Ruminococcaceae bacterium]|jgi:RNA polymerase sigma factor for flagellar operon FliA|nr:FliA/WhiG family RNA polymerase sigma factor [Oscillospiraceae bacterium]HBQ45564.1 FliA/WhiG family RNA polymerase sigma factor [Oscillospiraceae bacterium]HBT91369.1 FliA/WhiG family RNA polymerase sigma factor [Oscillospiraceae bacterium]HCB91780.1 FliA/WhiG family RNA polymerase sigma factor [Oscillospiraceae bacterium]
MNRCETARPPLQALWARYCRTRETALRDELIQRYAYLVRCIALKIVGRYQHFSDMEDIVSEGLIALMDAVQRFDLSKHVKFETYASIRIRGAMIDYIRRQDCFPRRLKKMARTLNDADEALNQRLGRSPTEGELAEYLNVSRGEYDRMLSETCSLNMLSFEEIVYEKGIENLKLRQAGAIAGPEQAVAEKELHAVLSESIEHLDDREKTVIALYYKEQLKIKEISAVLGISDSRVSQIHSSALRKLKKSLERYLNQ